MHSFQKTKREKSQLFLVAGVDFILQIHYNIVGVSGT